MRILVTGGNGYVGRELCRSLYQDHEVYVIDNLRYGSLRLNGTDLAHLQLQQIDLSDATIVRDYVKSVDPDAIIHLAAVHYIPECETNPALAVQTNVNGTVNLLDACPQVLPLCLCE